MASAEASNVDVATVVGPSRGWEHLDQRPLPNTEFEASSEEYPSHFRGRDSVRRVLGTFGAYSEVLRDARMGEA